MFPPIKDEELKLEGEIVQLKSKHEDFIAKENKIKSSKIEFDQEMEKFDSVIKDSKQKMNHWKKEVSVAQTLTKKKITKYCFTRSLNNQNTNC